MSLSPLSAIQSLTQTLLPRSAVAKAAAPTPSGTSTTQSSANAIGSTFLSLLVQELQNQDPTAPMDSTAMVGQMISLNQLNQLTSINQVLNNQFGSAATTASTSKVSGNVLSAATALPNVAQAALRLLNNNHAQAAALPSVGLPAF